MKIIQFKAEGDIIYSVLKQRQAVMVQLHNNE
jgi:hypothetical protein